jgi:hypothetical protein
MPPAVYTHVRTTIHTELLSLYTHVETPIEAPSKTDYGDVDVLVYQLLPRWKAAVEDAALTVEDSSASKEKATESGPTEDQIAALLGASTWKSNKGSEEIHFAIPWPVDFPCESARELAASSPPQASPATKISSQLSTLSLSSSSSAPAATPCIQLDLHICPTLQTYNWQLFRCAHGDFWIIVGSIIRKYGLSFRNDGLYLRIAEVEKVNRKGSLVLLSGNPREVLASLFGDGSEDEEGEKVEERYWKRDAFQDVEGMCDFIRRNCRFYSPDREGYTAVAGEDTHAAVELPASGESKPQVQNQPQIQKKDKYGFHKRGAFRYWLEEHVPAHSAADREAGTRGKYAKMKREEVAKMARERFGVVEEFERKKKVGLRMVEVERLWGDVRTLISVSLVQREEGKAKLVGFDTDATGNGEGKGEDKANGNGKAESRTDDRDESEARPQPQPIPTKMNFILRTLRRRLSIEARELSEEQLDEVQRAYREGDFEEAREWVGKNWMEVVESK